MSMDPILRTALDWFIRETDSRAALAEIHQALRELRSKVDKLPSRLFYLDSPDEPYDLAQILMAMGKHAVACKLDPETTVERKLLSPQVEEILEKAVALREMLPRALRADGDVLPSLPQSEIRTSMEQRGEPLPDRL